MNFFFDNTFAPGLARSLKLIAAGDHEGRHLLDHYEIDPGDLRWIEDVGQWSGQWIILSGDRRIATHPQKRQALLNSGRVIFFMPSGFPDLNRWEQASRLFRWFPQILLKANRPKHKVYDIKMNGSIIGM